MDPMQKWMLHYNSFVSIKISLTRLAWDNVFFWILQWRTRLVRLIFSKNSNEGIQPAAIFALGLCMFWEESFGKIDRSTILSLERSYYYETSESFGGWKKEESLWPKLACWGKRQEANRLLGSLVECGKSNRVVNSIRFREEHAVNSPR